MSRSIPVEPEWLKAGVAGRPAEVDRKNNVLRGYVVAQEGPFKTAGRGEFDLKSLEKIVELMRAGPPAGLKSRFTHPSLSSDALGSYLGRARNPSLDKARTADGQLVNAVRADLHLDPSSFSSPKGNLGQYVLDLAESDPDALSSSLVLRTEKEVRLDKDGTPVRDAKGEPLPPLWRPTRLHASDIVDTGDAVDGLLSADQLDIDGLPDAVVRRASEALDTLFAGQSREVVQTRVSAWLDRYLALRYGELTGLPGPSLQEQADAIRKREHSRRQLLLTRARAGA